MDKTLKTLHLRLDSTSKYLTENAVSQLIFKILYTHEAPVKSDSINIGLKKILKVEVNQDRITKALEALLDQKKVSQQKQRYSLTRASRKYLDNRLSESRNRLERIVDKYLAPFNSDRSDIIEWFSDVTIEFFKSYSSEWVSDLVYNKSEKLRTKKEDILKHIERRTKHNHNLQKDNLTELVGKFADCIISHKGPDLNAHLWEYGTSAFAANMLQSSIGADTLSIAAFRNSICVLDTNVLMNIGLEASEYHCAIKKLDRIFHELDIKTGYFKITEEEYISTISKKNTEIIRAVSKFPYEVIKETNDHFIQSALQRACHKESDFRTFCEQIALPPKKLESVKVIEFFNHDHKLEVQIQTAQRDPKRKEELNNLFREVTGNDKREAPLLHDVGLIAGIEYYRKEKKAFILSQEISINKYSHSKPLKDNLPIALRLETLINMLAIDNGGIDVNPEDFSELFADIVRYNLQPDADTFEVTDLSKMLDTELQIEQLPVAEVIKIANKLHKNRISGLNDEQIGLELNRDFQGLRTKFIDELDNVQESLAFEKRDKQQTLRKLSKAENALRDRIAQDEYRKYDRYVMSSKIFWYFIVPVIAIILTGFGTWYYNNALQQDQKFIEYVCGIALNIIFWVLSSRYISKPILQKKTKTRAALLEKTIDQRLEQELN